MRCPNPTSSAASHPLVGSLPFEQIWAIDSEYIAPPGERPTCVCLAAVELRSGRRVRLWRDELGPRPPYPTDDRALVVVFYGPAEWSFHLAAGWPLPSRSLDLFVEHRAYTNGRPTLAGDGLLGALTTFGLSAMATGEKAGMRSLVMRGGPWTEHERREILTYCQKDADMTAELLVAMLPHLLDHPKRLGQALWRAKYQEAVAKMEWAGIPLDVATWRRLTTHWDAIKARLVRAIDKDFGVYQDGCFSSARFGEYLVRHRIPWPRHDSGVLDLQESTFRERARAYPQIGPLRELRHTLSQLRLSDLSVGQDGRNRCMLSPFRSRTGRNQPSNSRYTFGPSVWLRSLIKPPPGHGLAYVDYGYQEVAIAAALSRDEALMAACESRDPYIDFAVRAGLAPAGATKASAGPMRDLCKIATLGIAYGMTATGLAARLDRPEIYARELLDAHRKTYPQFWRWSEAVVDYAMVHNRLHTMFGWSLRVDRDANPRSLRNWPVQSAGAEMLRLACIYASQAGLTIVAPVHDALMLEARLERLDEDVAKLRACMERASQDVLSGFTVHTDAKLIRWPDRYSDPRGEVMWKRITEILERIESAAA